MPKDNFEEYTFNVPQSLKSKYTGKIAGSPFRVASSFAGLPQAAMKGINYLSDLANPKGQGALNDLLPNFKIPQDMIEEAPSGESLNNFLKKHFGEQLPSNFFEHEPWIDNPLAAVASAPLMGMGMASSIAPAIGGEALRKGAENAKFGPVGQGMADLLGFYLGHKGQNLVGSMASKTPQIAKNIGNQFAEKNIPGLKPYNQMVSAEEKATLKSARAAENAATKTARQKSAESKYLEKFREENLAPRQEELSSLKTSQEESKLKLKEAEDISEEIRKFNSENISEESALDAQVKTRRDKIAKQIDNFQAQNHEIMSKEDATSLKSKIERGEKIPLQESLDKQTTALRDQLQGITGDIENLHTHEALVAQRFGAKPKELRTRINNLYSEFEDSIPESGLSTSGNKIEAVNKVMEKRLGSKDFSAGSYDFIRSIVDDSRKLIKDGQIDINELSKLAPKINNRVAGLRAERPGKDLIGIEKLYGEFTNAVKETIKGVKNQHPGVKTEKWFEANNMTRQLAENADASKWINASFQHLGLKSLSHALKTGSMLRSPEIRRYVLRAVTEHAAGDLRQATKNLIVADKMAERSLTKEAKNTKAHNAKLQKVVNIPKVGDLEFSFNPKG